MGLEANLASGIAKFNGQEFEVWSTLTEAVLTAKNLSHVLRGARPMIGKDEDSKAVLQWENDERSARALILLALEPAMVKLVLSCATPKEIWDRLKAVHSQTSESCKMMLQKEFYDAK